MTPAYRPWAREVIRSLSFELEMANLWIGLCKGHPGLPQSVAQLGYRLKWIGHKFRVTAGGHVCPDAMAASTAIEHTLLLEFKGGANIEDDQAIAYGTIASTDLERAGLIEEAASRSHDIVYVGEEAHGGRLRQGLTAVGCDYPLLLRADSGLGHEGGTFINAKVSAVLSPLLSIDWSAVPTNYIPVDEASPLSMVASVVVPRLLQYANEDREDVTIVKVCEDICTVWGALGGPAKDQFKARVLVMLREAASLELRNFVEVSQNGTRITLKMNPVGLAPEARTQNLKALRTAQRQLLSRLSQLESSGQLSFPFEP